MSENGPPHRPGSEHTPQDPSYADDETVTTRVTQVRVTIPDRKVRNKATLTVVSGPDTGRSFSLGPDVTIGRGRQCEIPLDDPSVSRTHTRIFLDPNGVRWLVDLGSRNGTFVDGFRVERHQLRDGDRIQLGPAVQFRYAVTDDEEERLLRELYESSVRDPLTGVFNRKHFNERLLSELAFAVRHGTELALLLFDIDHFKRVNDTWGHLAGDLVLKSIGNIVARTIRTEDVLARYGGEEFAIIARDISGPGAIALAERVRTLVEAARIPFEDKTLRVTISIGAATLHCTPGQTSADALVSVADKRLYAAKAAGRNRVIGPS